MRNSDFFANDPINDFFFRRYVAKVRTGIATGYGLDCPGSISIRARFFSSPPCPDRLWSLPGLLSDGQRELFSRGYSGRGVTITTYLHLVPRSRIVELYFHSLICLHGIVLY
jgi:hypothetical protein